MDIQQGAGLRMPDLVVAGGTRWAGLRMVAAGGTRWAELHMELGLELKRVSC